MMKVLFVCNNVYIPGNGICTSARTTTRFLKEAGIDVRLLSSENIDPNGDQPEFRLKRYHFPIFQPIIDANGFCYAQIEKDIVRQAVEWADIIHIEEPLFLQKEAIKVAEELGKPVVGTFHLYTQNLLSEIPLCSFGLSNRLLMKAWRNRYFNHCTDVQCPSKTVRNLLEKWNFKARLHVISNGIRIPAEKVIAQEPQMSPYILLSIGRFAAVKGQETLIKAMMYSRHASQIQLYFAGKGKFQEKLERMCRKLMSDSTLRYEPVFRFHNNPKELKAIAEKSYLYIHCAKIEVEGLGCIEAIREGVVPVIAKGGLIATSDVALDERSTFPSEDAKALAERIDWWIEHPEERIRMGQVYADAARQYSIHNSIDALIKMYNQALESRVKR